MLYLHCFSHTNKQKILFLHGFLGSTTDFLPIIKCLNQHFDCLGIDLPGHGKTEWVETLTKCELLNALASVIKNQSIRYLVGYSLGGRLAMEIDYRFPGLIQKLVILSSHPGVTAEEILIREKKINVFRELLTQSKNKFLLNWYQQPIFKGLSKKKILKKRKHFNIHAAQWILDELSLSKQPNLWNHVLKVSEKYYFICGGADLYYKKLYSRLTQKKIIIGSSHAVHIQNPQKCFRAIHKHLI